MSSSSDSPEPPAHDDLNPTADHEGPNGRSHGRGPVVRRNRAQLACHLCRNSKLKCDRSHPCSQCVRRGREDMCTYAKPVEKKKNQKKTNMQSRLKHLESLVVSMMKERDQPDNNANAPVLTPEESQASESPSHGANGNSIYRGSTYIGQHTESGMASAFGQVVVGKTQTTYVGATHWAAILDDIEEVKAYFQQEDDDELDPDEKASSTFVFGQVPYANKQQILDALPERPIMDRILSVYFNSDDHYRFVIHGPTFQREYRRFWADPLEAPTKWIALMCAMLAAGTFVNFRAGERNIEDRGTPKQLIATYRTLCAQCLILGDYAKPGPYTIEALLYYVQTEFLRTSDMPVNVWLLIGVTIRMALRMGYHRDSKHRPNISVFEGEMRRRLWFILLSTDLLLSFHQGLPSMIRAIQADTQPPSNLRDEDFGPESVLLPPSRPLEEQTTMAYAITKSRIASVFGIIAEQSNSTTLPSYAAVREVDNILVDAFNVVPSWLRVRPLSQCVTEGPETIMQRFNISHLFHKSRCVLHRRWLVVGQVDSKYSFSRKAALESSMTLLHYQQEIFEGGKPGGPLARNKWFGSGLLMHDFLLAAMIVCLALRHSSSGVDPESGVEFVQDAQQREMIIALQESYKVWKHQDESVDSAKAARVLAAMLSKLENRITDPEIRAEVLAAQPIDQPLRLKPQSPCGPSIGALNTIPKSFGEQAEADASQSVSNNAGGVSIDSMMANASTASSVLQPTETLDDLFNVPATTNIDWHLWDHHINGTTHPYGDFDPRAQPWAATSEMNVDFDDLNIFADQGADPLQDQSFGEFQ